MTTCNRCNGTGMMDSKFLPYLERQKPQPPEVSCTRCYGTGQHEWTENVRIPKKFIFALRTHFHGNETLTNQQAYDLYDAVVVNPDLERFEANCRTLPAAQAIYALRNARQWRYMNVRNYLCKLTNEGSLQRLKPGLYIVEPEDYENWFTDELSEWPSYARAKDAESRLEWERDQSKNLHD